MELIIPSRNKPTTGSFPTAPKKVRQWVSGLYPVTSANSTQTLIRGLKHCNRLENSARARMEILDIFRPVTREIIEFAITRYTGQNLPLGSKEYNAFKTVVTLLQEIAFGYKIVAAEGVQSAIPGSGKLRHQAIILALDTMNELALRNLQIYEDIPTDIWQDCNTLYSMAEELSIHNKPLGRDIGITHNLETPLEVFTATHILYLSGSHSLRRGQILQLHEFIAKHANSAQLQRIEDKPQGVEYLYGIDLHCATPASSLRFVNAEDKSTVRLLNLDGFLSVLASETNSTPNSVSALYESDVLTRESLHRLKRSMSSDRHVRQFSRQFCHEKLDFLHGLKEIYAVFRYADEPETTPAFLRAANEPKLELVKSDADNKKNPETDFITHPGFSSQQSDKSLWEAVEKGSVASTQQKGKSSSSLEPVVVDGNRGDWVLLNRSEGGLGLIWIGNSSPQITVGELVASRKLKDDDESNWITGMVTWLRVDEDQNLRCGISHVAQNVRPVIVERTRGSHNSITTQTECLLAQTLDSDPKPCIFVPAYMFHSGEVTHIRNGQNVTHYKLLDKIDSTGSFSLFTVEITGTSLTGDGLAKKDLGEFGLYDGNAQS